MEDTYPKFYLYKRIVQAKLYMDSNFAEKTDLNNIADEAYFSKFHFIRLFKKIYGKTPHQYLMLVRIEKAKELLRNGISIAEVCTGIGFESVSTFTGLFKRYVKVPPSTYQLQYQLRQEQIRSSPLKFIPNCFAEQKGWTKNSSFDK